MLPARRRQSSQRQRSALEPCPVRAGGAAAAAWPPPPAALPPASDRLGRDGRPGRSRSCAPALLLQPSLRSRQVSSSLGQRGRNACKAAKPSATLRVLTKALGGSAATSAVVTARMRQAHRLASDTPELAAASGKPSQLVTSTSPRCWWPASVRTYR